MSRNSASGFENRETILQGSEELIFKIVCQSTTAEQWAEWLRPPLEHAAAQANHELVEKLLKAGANGKAGWRGCHGRTLLDAAADGGSERVVSALLDAGSKPDINVTTEGTQSTALHRAARGGHADAARILLMAGANVNSLDVGQCSPLHLAFVKEGEQLACDLLLSGASPGAQDVYGFCPIHYAASQGRDRSVQLMLRKGVDINIRNTRGLTPLHAASIAGRVGAANLLLAAGADAGASDALGNSPLHHAAENNKQAIIKALVDAGSNIGARASDGWTPLHRATFHSSFAAMYELLRLGADVAAVTNAGWASIHVACWRGNPEATDLLLRWGADENFAVHPGKPARQLIPSRRGASEEDLPKLERLTRLVERAPLDRAWRRRGLLVMCRDRLEKVQVAAGVGSMTRQKHASSGSRNSKKAKMEVVFGSRSSRRGSASSVGTGNSQAGALGEKAGGGSSAVSVMEWVVHLGQPVIFRKIIGFL